MRVDRAGWGDLRGKQFHGMRAILRGLASHVDHRSGAGVATVAQIADASGGYSERWARHLLAELETIGAIAWTRGGVQHGRPVPSHFRVNKAWLVALAAGAVLQLAAILEARRVRTNRRIAGLNFTTRGRYRRRSVHAEPGTGLPPKGTGSGPLRAVAGTETPQLTEPVEPVESTGSGRRPGETIRQWADRRATEQRTLA